MAGARIRPFGKEGGKGEKEGGGGGYGGEEERYSVPEVSFASLSSKEKVYVFDVHYKVRFVKYLKTKLIAYRAKKVIFKGYPRKKVAKTAKKCSNIGFSPPLPSQVG